MLVELSMVEQRYLAVREVLDTGANVTDVATRYGVDRRTLHRWLVRYANHGLAALADRSSKPDRCPHQIAPEVEARIVELRRSHPGWGPRTILNKLRRELEVVPSRSAIYRCLVRAPPHRSQEEETAPRGLQTLGTIPLDGAVADRRHGRRPSHQRDPAVGRHRDRRPLALLCPGEAGPPSAGRISILKHRYHVGRHLAGEAVTIESRDGLLHVTHNGVVVATHARRHLIDDDDKMDRRAKAAKPATLTKGGEVLRRVDPHGSVSFAGTDYRVGNPYRGQTVGSVSSATPFRSPSTERSSGPTEPATTRRRSSQLWPRPTANPEIRHGVA
jgi:transposase-like protein